MIRTKGEAGTGDVSQAVKHTRNINNEINLLNISIVDNLSNEYRVPRDLIVNTMENKRLSVVNFAAGGIATPADSALMMKLGCDGVFVGSGIFASENPELMGNSIVNSVTYYNDKKKLYDICLNSSKGMFGINSNNLEKDKRFELIESINLN